MTQARQPITQVVGTSDDPCLVHQFIRLHGRRPDAAELADLAAGQPPAPAHRLGVATALSRAALRQVARLVCRL